MKISFISLGCAKNLVNTEQMMALCRDAGHTLQEEPAGADVVVINTCGFIDSAKEEAIDTILSAAELKAAGQVRKILVTGCLTQRYQQEILTELPEVDGIMGTGSYGEIVSALAELMAGGRPCRFADIHGMIDEFDRVLTTPKHYAYLRIAEGCDNRCAYCVIPSLRGKYRSRPMNELLDEAAELASAGVKELIVIAQDITRYGTDLNGEHQLAKLLKELCKLDFHWIRLHYLYPTDTTDELIDVQDAVPDIYQANGIWIMHPKTRTAIRKLKDSEGRYLLNLDLNAKWGYSLLGKPVYASDAMPEPAAGAKTIFYGDMSGLACIIRGLRGKVLAERFAEENAIGIVGFDEIDAKGENAQKISVHTMKSAT